MNQYISIALLLNNIIFIVLLIILFKKYNHKSRYIIDLEKRAIVLSSENSRLQEQISQTAHSEQILASKFENYVNKVLYNKVEHLQQATHHSIDNLLNPLKEKINEFQHKVEKTYQDESREIFSLKNEVHKLIINNTNMARETENLTNALKGNVKAQGIWGELVLERVLERAGLQEGVEYITQGKDLKLRDDDNKSVKPDVIINLPDEKHIIIDSKVSLTHYEQCISSLSNNHNNSLDNAVNNRDNSNHEYKRSLDLFIRSVQDHITNLSSKNYQYNEKLLSPDFVIMFFPIEGAFSLVLQTMPELLMQAWHKKIVIVSPTTLFATLKTVASIWLFEKQNKNAMQIARESGLLYDKFVAFTEDLVKVGQAIDKADEAYHQAVNKLSSGRGNIINRTEKIKKLGAKTKKKLADSNLVKSSEHHLYSENDSALDANQDYESNTDDTVVT